MPVTKSISGKYIQMWFCIYCNSLVLFTHYHYKDVKLQAKEKERLRAVHTVRQYVLQAAVDKEKEDEGIHTLHNQLL